MKLFIKKILWGFTSSIICILYRLDANGALCNYTNVLRSELVYTGGTLAPHNVCSGSTICDGGTCGGKWVREIPELSEREERQTICQSGQYVSSCRNSGGQIINNPSSPSRCASDYGCTSCPSDGRTAGLTQIVHHGLANVAGEIYFCSNTDPSGKVLPQGTYMQVIKVNCDSYSSISWKQIVDCYLPPNVTFNDTAGSYVFTSSCMY